MQKRRRKLKIDYNKKKYSNPFFQNKKPHSNRPKSNSHWKIKLSIFLICLITLALVWLLLFSKFFDIKTIKITAPDNIAKDEITNLIWQQADQKMYLVASQKNIWLFDQLALENNLKARYAIGQLIIKKKIPNTLDLSIKGKSVVLIWHEAGKYYYVFDDNSTTETDPLQIKDGSLTVINNAGQSKIVNGLLLEDNTKLVFSTNLNTKLKNNSHQLQIEGLVNQDNQENTVNVKVQNGPLLLFSTKENIDMQLTKLYAIITNRSKESFIKIDHLDLRFGDNVYIK